jgi:lysophospholipase L1-like esterase
MIKIICFIGLSLSIFYSIRAQNNFEAAIKAYEKKDSVQFPPKGKILLTGSSSIEFWRNYQIDFQGFTVINRGIAGTLTSDAIYFCHRIITPYQAKQIFLYVGDNDLNAGKNPQEVLKDIQQLTNMIREKLPDSQLFFISIKPSPARATLLATQIKTNQLLLKFCKKQKKVQYLDVFTPMLNAKGQPDEKYFEEDKLHLNSQGYAIWTKVLRKVMRE